MTRILFITAAWLLSSCAVEVGNPHPEPVGKSSVKISMQATGNLDVDQVDLNLVGVKLIRSDAETQNISFSSNKLLTIVKGEESKQLAIHRATTQNTGNYAKVRMYFDKSDFGSVTLGSSIFPLTLGQGASFLDVPIDFSLKNGEQTNIALKVVAGNIISEVKDEQGQVTSYTMSSEFDASAGNEAAETIEEETKDAFRFYRLAVRAVNDGDKFEMSKFSFLLNGVWSTANLTSSELSQLNESDNSNVVLTMGNSGFKIGASTNSKNAWRVFRSGGLFSPSYDSDDTFSNGSHKLAAFEWISFEFTQAVGIRGYEFKADGNENCPLIYDLQASSNGTDWTILDGSTSTLEACDLVNVTW